MFEPIQIKCIEQIARPAADVWTVLRKLEAKMMPDAVIEGAHLQPSAADGAPTQVIQISETVSMVQRATEIDDAAMTLRMEMISGSNVVWSDYRSRIQVEPAGQYKCQVTVAATATPTVEPRHVEGMLKGLIILSLETLKKRMESSKP